MTGRISSALLTTITMSGGMAFMQAAPASAQVAISCIVQNPQRMPAEGRRSPLDSVIFRVAGEEVKICYGRPSSRGRTMIGGSRVPFGRLWRTGANEPTLLRTPIALSIAGVRVAAGTYAIYTVPGPAQWEIILNRSYTQWGHEDFYTEQVQAQEVGRGRVASEPTDVHIETFTIRAEETPSGLYLILEWERTRVRVPVSAAEQRSQ